jgi:hypothetical protein
MRRRPGRRPLKSGLDPVGPFHPYLAYAAVLLFNLAAVVLGIAILLWAADLVEDRLWPGGSEWIDF